MQNKKRLVAVTIVGLSTLVMFGNASAVESANGLYLGAQGGLGMLHQDGPNSSDNGLAGRLFAGFKINQNFAVESGYTKFTDATFSDTISNGPVFQNIKAKIQAYAVDLVIKGILPLQDGFDLYGKVGGAYLNEKASATDNFSAPGASGSVGVSSTDAALLPTFGGGVSYTFNPNLTGDVSWMHIQKINNDTDLNNTDFFGVGLTYNFG